MTNFSNVNFDENLGIDIASVSINNPLQLQLNQTLKSGNNIIFIDGESGKEIISDDLPLSTQPITHNQKRGSWQLTQTGSFQMNGLKIKRGIINSPSPVKQKRINHKIQNHSAHAVVQMNPNSDCNILKSAQELEVICMLGSGAAGTVKKVLHTPSQTVIAVKYIDFVDDNKRKQFADEIRLYLQYSHPYIVSFKGCCIDVSTQQLLLALEFCEHGSLESWIKKNGVCTEVQCKGISKQILSALAYLESEKTVHRDIKPANILLDAELNAKIADFGITKTIEATMGFAKTQIGTMLYMAPERMSGEEYSFKSDVWSFGLTLLFCCTGQAPYKSEAKNLLGLHMAIVNEPPLSLPSSDVNDVAFSMCFQSFVAACLYKDPKQRWKASDLLLHPYLTI